MREALCLLAAYSQVLEKSGPSFTFTFTEGRTDAQESQGVNAMSDAAHAASPAAALAQRVSQLEQELATREQELQFRERELASLRASSSTPSLPNRCLSAAAAAPALRRP